MTKREQALMRHISKRSTKAQGDNGEIGQEQLLNNGEGKSTLASPAARK